MIINTFLLIIIGLIGSGSLGSGLGGGSGSGS